MPIPVIAPAGPGDLAAIREMLAEYAAWTGVDLAFQHFAQEVQGLPGDYEAPTGALLIARLEGQPAGMVALRARKDGQCEMKRLYVRPEARGVRLGRLLAERIIEEAKARGYRTMLLDTLPIMKDAQRLYVELGFVDIAPYYDSPIEGTRFMSLDLFEGSRVPRFQGSNVQGSKGSRAVDELPSRTGNSGTLELWNSGTSVVFETHATSLDNEAGLASGWFDVTLSEKGEVQARALGERRRADNLSAVFCSDLTRAVRTAEIAFADRSISIVRDARLRECDYGTLTRHAVSEIEAQRHLRVTTPFPGGESYQQVVDRVGAWLTEIAEAFAGQTVLVVGHRATFYALEHSLRGV